MHVPTRVCTLPGHSRICPPSSGSRERSTWDLLTERVLSVHFALRERIQRMQKFGVPSAANANLKGVPAWCLEWLGACLSCFTCCQGFCSSNSCLTRLIQLHFVFCCCCCCCCCCFICFVSSEPVIGRLLCFALSPPSGLSGR